jgi:hypothetical protein
MASRNFNPHPLTLTPYQLLAVPFASLYMFCCFAYFLMGAHFLDLRHGVYDYYDDV